MKKIILFFSILFALNASAQLATSSKQTEGNATLTAIYNKVDTTTMVFIKSYKASGTYSIANAACIGTIAAVQWSIALGPQYWEVQSVEVDSYGGNYGPLAGSVVFLKDSLTLTDNKTPSPITTNDYRSPKLLTVFSNVGTSQNNFFGTVQHFGPSSSAIVVAKSLMTGNVWIYAFSTGVTNHNSNTINIKVIFRKIKN